MKEDREGAGFHRAVKAGSLRQGELPEAGPQSQGGSKSGDPAQRTARLLGRQRGVHQHDGHAGQGENDLGEDADRCREQDSPLALPM